MRSAKDGVVTPFSGLIKCVDCGYKMVRDSYKYTVKGNEKKVIFSYNCRSFASKGKTACTSHYITEKVLSELVIADIREKAGEILQDEGAARERFYAIKAQTSGTQIAQDKAALKKINKRLGELDRLIQAAFEKSVLGGDSSGFYVI